MKQYETGQLRNVAILSHEGAGKTLLSEVMLYTSGALTRIGKIEDGTTASDFDADEIKHKVSISAAVLPVEWQNHKINLIDTPGYADFVGEVKSAVRVADAAMIVVCGANGIEVGTEMSWTYADEQNLPRLLVINRLDREHSDFAAILAALQSRLSAHAVAIQWPLGQESGFRGYVDLLSGKAYTTQGGKVAPADVPASQAGDVQRQREALIEAVAETDDDLINRYLEGEELDEAAVRTALHKAVLARQIFPVVCTSAQTQTNIGALLDTIVEFLPSPAEAQLRRSNDDLPLGNALAAFVFKTVADPFGKLSYIRVVAGTLKSDSHIFNCNRSHEERVGQLLAIRGKTQEPIAELVTGDIGAALKLQDTLTGDTLCTREKPVQFEPLSYPLISFSAAVEPKTRADLDKLGSALNRLTQEDPTMQMSRDAVTGQMILSGMGETHLDVAVERLHRKFQVDVTLAEPRVPFRETISGTAKDQGRFKRQTGGHGQFGDVWMEISPLPRGGGFEFVDNIVGGAIPRNFIPAVEKGVQEALVEGILAGNPIVDVRVRIYDGSFHPVDSSEMAFKIAGSMAFKKCMEKAHPILLEPIMEVEVTVPENYMGDVIGDLTSKRARILGMDSAGEGTQKISAHVPLAEMGRYGTALRSITQGRATYSMRPYGYEEVPNYTAQQIIAAYNEQKEHNR